MKKFFEKSNIGIQDETENINSSESKLNFFKKKSSHKDSITGESIKYLRKKIRLFLQKLFQKKQE